MELQAALLSVQSQLSTKHTEVDTLRQHLNSVQWTVGEWVERVRSTPAFYGIVEKSYKKVYDRQKGGKLCETGKTACH